MPKGAESATSRDRILRAALVLFQRNGYDGTSLKTVAKEIGVSAPAIYWHFDSKDQLYFEAVRQLLADFFAYVYARTESEQPVRRLQELVTAHVMFQLEEPELAGAFSSGLGTRGRISSLPEDQQKELIEPQRDYLNEVQRILEAGLGEGSFHFENARITALAVITHCEGAQAWFVPGGSLGAPDVARLYCDLALQMVGYDI